MPVKSIDLYGFTQEYINNLVQYCTPTQHK